MPIHIENVNRISKEEAFSFIQQIEEGQASVDFTLEAIKMLIDTLTEEEGVEDEDIFKSIYPKRHKIVQSYSSIVNSIKQNLPLGD